MNVKDNIKNSLIKLQNAAVGEPHLDIKILLEHAINQPREFLIAHDDYELTEAEQKVFDEYICRRAKREPVAQIIEMKEFYGREFFISPNVLVPRPETEIIIDAAKELFSHSDEINILDLGTGSGAIILTLLAEFPKAKGVAVDISELALANAKKNAYKLGITNVKFVRSDWLNQLEIENQIKFDLIVSNPPYIPEASIETLEAELGFEPMKALSGGSDGLDCYREIAQQLVQQKTKLGIKHIILELGISQDKAVRKIFEEFGFVHHKTIKDYRQIDRTIIFSNIKNIKQEK